MNTKTKSILIISSIILGIIFIFAFSQGFALFSQKVMIPGFFRADCLPRAENMQMKDITTHTDSGKWYHCNTQESGTYVPKVNGIQCMYNPYDWSTLIMVKCKGYIEDKNKLTDTSICTPLVKGVVYGDSFDGYVDTGDSVYIDTSKVFGDAKLRVKYPAYGIKAISSNNYGFDQTTNCEISSVYNSGNYHTIDAKNMKELPPGISLNVFQELREAITTQVVIISSISPNPIYILNKGEYYDIKTSDDGIKYVDISESGRHFDTRIQCVPLTLGCDAEAKIVDITNQKCGSYSLGQITGYAPVVGSTKVCRYKCTSTGQIPTTDCKETSTHCPEDKPVFDYNTGMCITLSKDETCPNGYVLKETTEKGILSSITTKECVKTTDWTMIYIIIGFVVLIIILLTIFIKVKK